MAVDPTRSDPTPGVPRRAFFARVLGAIAGGLVAGNPRPAAAVTGEPFVGEIRVFAGDFAPDGWALCDGQILAIQQNTALFSIIGTYYGGDGQSTFALPDFRGRTPIHWGQGPGLSFYDLGQVGGVESVSLSPSQIPAHNHSLKARSTQGDGNTPAFAYPAASPSAIPRYHPTANASLAVDATQMVGTGSPHNNMQPFLTLNFIIALQGQYPSHGAVNPSRGAPR